MTFFSPAPKKPGQNLAHIKKIRYLCTANKLNGVLAHLARARHWQCRGERFESAILHPGKVLTDK